jgi:tetratricopeptide (TPR) repeat protein
MWQQLWRGRSRRFWLFLLFDAVLVFLVLHGDLLRVLKYELGYIYRFRADIDYRKKDYQAAIDSYSTAIGLNSRDYRAYFGRGIAYGMIGNTDKIIADETKFLQLGPGPINAELRKLYFFAYNFRAGAAEDRHRYDLAISDQTHAIALKDAISPLSSVALSYEMRGNAYLEKFLPDNAMADETKAIALDPSDGRMYLLRGLAFEEKNRRDLAMADYAKEIALEDPGLAMKPVAYDVFERLGLAYERMGDFREAIMKEGYAIARQPRDGKAYIYSGLAFDQYGSHKFAMEQLQSALKIDPELQAEWNLLKRLDSLNLASTQKH